MKKNIFNPLIAFSTIGGFAVLYFMVFKPLIDVLNTLTIIP